MRVIFTAKTWSPGTSATATLETGIAVANLKNNQQLFRYENETTKVSGLKPLILIDIEKKLAYFLKDTESEQIAFESKGTPINVWKIEN